MSIAVALKDVAEGRELSPERMKAAFEDIVEGRATDAQIAGLAVGLRVRGETPGEIATAARVMRERATRVVVDAADFVDTCGTGGDGAGTFNISTTAAFVVAACGLRVAKHGNRGVSSRSGSADVLQALGVNIDAPLDVVQRAIQELRIGFLYAPLYHGALKHAANARREIGVRTFFNLLGPLANPAGAPYQLMGIYEPTLLETVGPALAALGTKGALVVHGEDGLDEVTLTGKTWAVRVKDGKVTHEEIDPRKLGLQLCKPEDLRGGDPAENAAITRAILGGEQSPRRDAVALNAAATLVAANRGAWDSSLALAQQAITSGAALRTLDALIAATAKPGSMH